LFRSLHLSVRIFSPEKTGELKRLSILGDYFLSVGPSQNASTMARPAMPNVSDVK